MSQIRDKNTTPELKLRKKLFKEGFRYRIHTKQLPGKPDIVLKKFKTVVFVHGCFWHFHTKCNAGHIPNSRKEYWIPKLTRNVHRDLEHLKKLQSLGWHVITIWECEILNDLDQVTKRVVQCLNFRATN